MKLLFAEDEKSLSKAVTAILTKNNYVVDAVYDGQDALDYLETGDYKTITHTVVNALAVVSGIICDGAKSSCAAKIAAAVEAGIFGYHMYLNGQQFYGGDGILRKGIEQTLENIGELGRVGMEGTNDEIVRLMLEDTRPC